FKKFNIKNAYDSYPITFITDIEIYNWGFEVGLFLEGFCSYTDIEEKKDFLLTLFNAEEILFSKDTLKIVTNIPQDINFKKLELKNTQLLCGYDNFGLPVVADMVKCPHVLVTGLSGQGKTGLLQCILKNIKDADVVICNGFLEDFKQFNYRKIFGEEKIINFLEGLLDDPHKRERPLYIILEELATYKDKRSTKIIKELLCIARHYNIYLIGVIQIATKEELKFKSYFNTRCSFKQIDESSYRVALGCSVDSALNNREFYLYTDNLYKCKTYNLA
uniref:hypothetical protein n=1 Tax=Clostridium botulinum TaxID=1491 RepID=UPI000A7A55E1